MEIELLTGLRNYIVRQLVQPVQMEIGAAHETANHYVEMLVAAGFNYTKLHEYKNEPLQTMYGHLLDCLRILPFERYPTVLSKNHLDTHLSNIAHFSLNYFAAAEYNEDLKQVSGPSNLTANLPDKIDITHQCQKVPVGGNTTNQLPPRKYIFISMSVDTVPDDDRRIVWNISAHIPNLPEQDDPDYECLIFPHELQDKSPETLAHLGFDYGNEEGVIYHHGTEFGRRKLEPEDVGLEKFANFLFEIRNGLHGAGPNNGIIWLFETSEDLALVNQLFARHNHEIFLDIVKGVTCLDHYLQITHPECPATYSTPSYQYPIGRHGCWRVNVSLPNKLPQRLEATSKPECLFYIFQIILGTPLAYNNFIKWYSYHSYHSEVARMMSTLNYIDELIPLQNYIDQQLFYKKIPIALEGLYAAHNEVEATLPYNACARQTIRRLLALNYTLDVLTKIFKNNPNDIIRPWILLQTDEPLLRLRLHDQTVQICIIIKDYFVTSDP